MASRKQNNVTINTDYYREDQILDAYRRGSIFDINGNPNEVNYEDRYRLDVSKIKELVVQLNQYGYYTNIAKLKTPDPILGDRIYVKI